MGDHKPLPSRRQIVARAIEWGADMAGIARVADLKQSPSHTIGEKRTGLEGEGSQPVEKPRSGNVHWPEGLSSAIVIAIEHPREAPALDWWVSGNTEGNRRLMAVIEKLARWFEHDLGVRCVHLPYHIARGGIYLKDAAAMAGLGCIGRNNLLLTPAFGPRQRLRAVLVDADLAVTGPNDFDPCTGCDMPCRMACPQKAFGRRIFSAATHGLGELPGRTGDFDRVRCNRQMLIDEANAVAAPNGSRSAADRRVVYCRRCELACPVGRIGQRG